MGEDVDDEQGELLTPALQRAQQAILIIQQGEEKNIMPWEAVELWKWLGLLKLQQH